MMEEQPNTAVNICLLHFHSQVPPKKDDVDIQGLPESVLDGQEVDFNCTVSHILPPVKNMFWIVDGETIKPTVESFKNEDETFRHSIDLNYT